MRWDNDFLAEIKRQELEEYWKQKKNEFPIFVLVLLVIIIILSHVH